MALEKGLDSRGLLSKKEKKLKLTFLDWRTGLARGGGGRNNEAKKQRDFSGRRGRGQVWKKNSCRRIEPRKRGGRPQIGKKEKKKE